MACCVLMAACCNTSPGNGTGEKPDEPLQMHSGGGLGEWRESCFRGILLQKGLPVAGGTPSAARLRTMTRWSGSWPVKAAGYGISFMMTET